ncbi:MAG: hypothetical protein NZM35_08665 [Chitinophagales bacterium]|nr:hypothetical protein [Chitinophagales bacterium]MDW8419020.1 hypothetical protein [Chitinophagales bacterium]
MFKKGKYKSSGQCGAMIAGKARDELYAVTLYSLSANGVPGEVYLFFVASV